MPREKARLRQFYLFYLLSLFLIYPLSPFAFRTFLTYQEAYFKSPIKVAGEIQIRSDSMGDGRFGALRSGGRRRHKGVDIKADIGTPVLAARSGVARTGWIKGGMGKYVKIAHLNECSTVYGHLSKISVSSRQWIWQGQKIGAAGKTGNAKHKKITPHLHFEIRKNGKAINPMLYIGQPAARLQGCPAVADNKILIFFLYFFIYIL